MWSARVFRSAGLLVWLVGVIVTGAPPAPEGVVAYGGDRCVLVHWERGSNSAVSGYRVLGASASDGPFTFLGATGRSPGFAHLEVTNGAAWHYVIRAVDEAGREGPGTKPVTAEPRVFEGDAEFLEFLQRSHFAYFWYGANPTSGLVPDRSTATSPCSIAAVGFGLSALTVGVDHGWISRAQARQRVRTTLRTLRDAPQGDRSDGVSGHRGWFYHFLDMNSATRVWSCELSSIDTALLLAGVLHARQYFDGADPEERAIRALANELFGRVDWHWMRDGREALSMGWKPESGFLPHRWVGYNEAMILYLLGLGAAANPLLPTSWTAWTSGYAWETRFGQSYLTFPPLFGHQYSHCWVDFRHTTDAYLRRLGMTYFENSRRATLAQRSYCIENPGRFRGYASNVWGLTACDGPGTRGVAGYHARGAPPAQHDDGTLAPTAVGGSMPFAPEVCLPALRHLYSAYRAELWTAYGFRDAFSLQVGWWGPDTLGIDQGPMVLMLENHLTQRVWERFMTAPEIRRGLERAGFQPLSAGAPAPAE